MAHDRDSYNCHNLARAERNRRRRAYKRLNSHDRQMIIESMKDLQRKLGCLNEMGVFDLIGSIGEFIVRKESERGAL